MLTIRSDDVPAFRTLAMRYEAELPPHLRHTDAECTPEIALVAVSDGTPCGCVALSMLDVTTAVMKRLYVLPEHRGIGVARVLVDAVVRIARDHGCRRIVLDTDRRALAPAYALYRSYGFVECEAYGPVNYATPTFMELALGVP